MRGTLAMLAAALMLLPCRVGAAPNLARQARRLHVAQIHRGARQCKRADRQVGRLYARLARMKRGDAARLLTELVRQSSSGQPGRLYPRLTIRNHDRHNAVCQANLRRLLRIAVGLSRGARRQRAVARSMVAAATTQDYRALVSLVQVSGRLGWPERARQFALQALLAFGPAARLVFEEDADRDSVHLSRSQAAEITVLLRAVRGPRTGWHAYRDLRRADSATYGRSAVPRLQAIAYLARDLRGPEAVRLMRELGRWQSAVSEPLKVRPGDRWIRAREDARRTAMGLGYLLAAPVRIARRR